MAKTDSGVLQVDLLTPDKKVFSGEVTYVKAPGEQGYLGILHNHAPLLAALQIGEVELEAENVRKYFAVSGGFLEVINNHVRVLAETAEPSGEIDLSRAQEAKSRAEKHLAATAADNADVERARVALYRAVNRIKIAGK